MSGRQPAHLRTAAGLRALRVRLTVLLLVLNVAGLAGMGAVALVVDGRQRDEVTTAELRRTAGTAVALLDYDAGSLSLDKLFNDPAAQGSTGVYVYEGGRTDVALVFAHPAGLPVIPPPALLGVARTVWRTGEASGGAVAQETDGRLPMLAVPFRHAVTGAVAGTVVVVADPRPGRLAHDRLALALAAGGAVFMLLAGFGGYLLARRGTRPVAEALDQQERFVADAAHELRTPLTVIRAVCEAAADDPAAQPGALHQVLAATRRLVDSVDALLNRARMVAGLRELRREPFRLDQLAEEVLRDVVAPPHELTVSAADTVAHGDPTLVRIAVRNLAHNAVRHGRQGQDPARVRLVVADGLVIVEDGGPGMGAPPERFHTGADDGVGLGLALAQWVAELHGGVLRLEQAPGGGTSAVLTLPDTALSRPARRWAR